jgi:predicted RNA-binding Zn ribbon-like protein
MPENQQTALDLEQFEIMLVTNRSSLNFVNTVDSHERAIPKEYLKSYKDLLAWSRLVGICSPEELSALKAHAEQQAQEADWVLQEAYRLRYDLYRMYLACIEHTTIPEAALQSLNELLARAPLRRQLRSNGYALVWDLPSNELSLELPLWQIAWDAAALLTSSELARLRRCSGEGCSWMFLDTSRAQNRRWCMMGWCGNRAKARRHYQRQRNNEIE